jgi:hypothetical protein
MLEKMAMTKDDVKLILEFFDNLPSKDYCLIKDSKGHERLFWRKDIDWLKGLLQE